MNRRGTSGFDIAPFALPNGPPGEVRFEEPRDILRVVVTFSAIPPAGVKLQYLRKAWPQNRPEEAADGDMTRPASFGWVPLDDWFNTTWYDAAVRVRRNGPRVRTFTFRELSVETPDAPAIQNYDVKFRRTLGIRLVSPVPISRVQVFTRSVARRTRLRVELDAGRMTRARTIELSGYNAVVRKISARVGTTVQGTVVRLRSSTRRSFLLDVHHMAPCHRYCYDDGLVTFKLGSEAFTISLVSLEAQGPVWFAEQGVYVAGAVDPTTFAQYRAANAGRVTIAQAVAARPEQTLAGAMNGQPRPHPIPYVFGCKHARQKFWLEPNGDLEMNAWLVTRQPARDTTRWKNRDNGRFFFGLENWSVEGRFNDPWPVVSYNLHVKSGALRLQQKSFAVPLQRPILAGEPASDDTIVALVRFRFENAGDCPVLAELPVGYSSQAHRSINRRLEMIRGPRGQSDGLVPLVPRDPLRLQGDRLISDFSGQLVLRAVFQTNMEAASGPQGVCFRKRLAPGESCQVMLRVPFVAVESAEELHSLRGLTFDRCYGELKRYWWAEGARGASISTPEPHLNAVYAGHLPMVLMSDLGFPDGSQLVNTSVGAAVYGNFTNESCMILEELDQRGLNDEARRRLGVWVKYQGTARLRGNFSEWDSVYFGAGGLESGESYNQHHGWALWRLARHFLHTGDREWFATVVDSVLAGADWIFRQRRQTSRPLPHSRGWERGFLPAGALEDVGDYFYWLSTNALTWRGADVAAAALEAMGHPQAARVRREADAFARDLRRGFETARKHSPLVRLRDGRWVPHYPSRLYRRGRDAGWIREVLEGSVYLLISGLYDSRSKPAQWILDDYLDTRYMNPPLGYPIQDEAAEWFDCGGFSVQPNLLAGLLPYLDRDEIEIYLWMFFNAWAACYRGEVNAMVEHPMPVLGFSNSAPFKTSDQSNAVKWLAYMFVYERGELLHLGRAIPRAWLAGGQEISARRIATSFGTVSICYRGSQRADKIQAEADLALRRAPGQLLVRFRHAAKRPIRSVTVNGKDHAAFVARTGDVDVTGHAGRFHIQASF